MPTSEPAGRSSQLSTIVLLFVSMRLLILLMYTPQGLLNAYTNYHFYYLIAQFGDDGHYPFLNMWFEYPPLSAYLTQLPYWLLKLVWPHPGDVFSFSYQLYARLLGCLFLPFETGVLVLIHRLVAQWHSLERADWAAWVYAGLGFPIFFWNTSHDVLVAFWTLLALERFLQQRQGQSALALGLGMASKLTPLYLFFPLGKFLWERKMQVIRYGLIVAGVVLAIYAPFVLLGGGPWVVASFMALSKVGSWATPWAIMDGNWEPGTYGDRLDLAAAAVTQTNPSVLPGWFPLILVGGVYIMLWRRWPTSAKTPRHLLAASLLSALVFLLWSKGWSPAWSMLVIPLILIVFPTHQGLRWIMLLSGLVFLEWPVSDVLKLPIFSALIILARSALFVFLAFQTWRILRASPAPTLTASTI